MISLLARASLSDISRTMKPMQQPGFRGVILIHLPEGFAVQSIQVTIINHHRRSRTGCSRIQRHLAEDGSLAHGAQVKRLLIGQFQERLMRCLAGSDTMNLPDRLA